MDVIQNLVISSTIFKILFLNENNNSVGQTCIILCFKKLNLQPYGRGRSLKWIIWVWFFLLARFFRYPFSIVEFLLTFGTGTRLKLMLSKDLSVVKFLVNTRFTIHHYRKFALDVKFWNYSLFSRLFHKRINVIELKWISAT